MGRWSEVVSSCRPYHTGVMRERHCPVGSGLGSSLDSSWTRQSTRSHLVRVRVRAGVRIRVRVRVIFIRIRVRVRACRVLGREDEHVREGVDERLGLGVRG